MWKHATRKRGKMSLMFAKSFSEAGTTSSTGRKGGRGKGSGMMAKSKGRKGRDLEEGENGSSSGGLFALDANGPYRTHMLFPGRKEEEAAGPDPRRSSGSPGFMKSMMSWSKRPSDPRSAGSQEMQQTPRSGARTTPPTRTESELLVASHASVDPYYNYQQHRNIYNNNNKSVSFHEGVSHHARYAAGGATPGSIVPSSNPCVTRSLTLSPTNTYPTAGGSGHNGGHDYSYCSYSNRESVYAIFGKKE